MHSNWIDLAGLLVIVWFALRQAGFPGRVKKLEATIRQLEIQCNTLEMNVKKLYHFRDIEVHEPNEHLSDEDRRGLDAELSAEIDTLAEDNERLMTH